MDIYASRCTLSPQYARICGSKVTTERALLSMLSVTDSVTFAANNSVAQVDVSISSYIFESETSGLPSILSVILYNTHSNV